MGDDDLTTAERALSDAALAGDTSAQALCAEIERLRLIEAAARAAYDAEDAWRENGGMNPGLAGAMLDAQAALRIALAKGGAK